jgi:PDDEXK-like domain of unknown function (DUF3799)
MIITEPGLYDIPEAEYHADPVPGGSLSSSMAKWLLPPSAPAIAQYKRAHPEVKTEFDLGSGAHKLILGKGAEIAVIQHEKWNTNVAKAEVAAARAAGKIPLKPDQFAAAELMAEAVKRHPTAGPLFAPGTGLPERSIFWRHERTGTWCRAMLDWLSLTPGFPALVVDLKTIEDASLERVRRQVADLRYYQQDPFYRSAVESLGYEDVLFLFVFVSKKPPHLVTVFELDPEDLAEGRARNEEALDVWIECQALAPGVQWPGYSTEIRSAALPPWTHRQIEVIE